MRNVSLYYSQLIQPLKFFANVNFYTNIQYKMATGKRASQNNLKLFEKVILPTKFWHSKTMELLLFTDAWNVCVSDNEHQKCSTNQSWCVGVVLLHIISWSLLLLHILCSGFKYLYYILYMQLYCELTKIHTVLNFKDAIYTRTLHISTFFLYITGATIQNQCCCNNLLWLMPIFDLLFWYLVLILLICEGALDVNSCWLFKVSEYCM